MEINGGEGEKGRSYFGTRGLKRGSVGFGKGGVRLNLGGVRTACTEGFF